MGANCREDNSLLFGKTNYINSFSILLKTKNYVSVFLVFVNFQNVGQGAIWREIMLGEVSSIIHSSMLWV